MIEWRSVSVSLNMFKMCAFYKNVATVFGVNIHISQILIHEYNQMFMFYTTINI